jgi:ribA/ribD-fused uncharacterized protein
MDPELEAPQISGFRGEHVFLSNFHNTPITLGEITFQNAEAAFQAQKSTDPAVQRQFAHLTAREAKALGRKIALRPGWNELRLQVMEEVVRCKFLQNPPLQEKLKATRGKSLVETNTWGDRFWGKDPCGNGQNHLGRILEKIRASL